MDSKVDINLKFNSLRSELDIINSRVDAINEQFENLNNELQTLFKRKMAIDLEWNELLFGKQSEPLS